MAQIVRVEGSSNRTREQIIAEMLESLRAPVRKTTVMYGARLSYNQLRLYHAILLSRGLVAKAGSAKNRAASLDPEDSDGEHKKGRDDGLWVATERGRQYLEAYATLRAIAL